MSTKVECNECEWRGTERDLHYKKERPWAFTESPICPNCGGNVIYDTPLPERTIKEYSEIAKFVWCRIIETPCEINGVKTTFHQINDVWGLIEDLENFPSIDYLCDVLKRTLEGNKDVRVEFDNKEDNINFVLDVCSNFKRELQKDRNYNHTIAAQ